MYNIRTMDCSKLSFLSGAKKIILRTYELPQGYSVILAGVISRLAAVILLSSSAALDIALHSLLIFPTIFYAIGKSIYEGKANFEWPWRHLERVRNAITPLLFGSVFAVLHPFAGIAVSEPTDKHIVMGMIFSNTDQRFNTPCSPIHSLSIIKDLAKKHRFAEKHGVKQEIFPEEYAKGIREANQFEKSLEALQAQEYINKITNMTLFAMAGIVNCIHNSDLGSLSKEALIRLSGLLIPIFTIIDMAIALIAQTFFLATGIVRCLTGRGPIYTEVTTCPLMHVAFFIQNILKTVGGLIGTVVYFISPKQGFVAGLVTATLSFKFQVNRLMQRVKQKMDSMKENTRFVVPIVFGNGVCSPLSLPFHTMHTTYLIVEKNRESFNLYWVNRPNVSLKRGVSQDAGLKQIRSMLDERFPFMDIEKIMKYPVISKEPEFSEATPFAKIAAQGNCTNCVVSNLFGTLEALDQIRGENLSELRYETVRASLMEQYAHYREEFSPFATPSERFSFATAWNQIRRFPNAPI